MKKTLAIIAMLVAVTGAYADEAAKPVRYVDAETLRLANKAFSDTERTYSRLPKYLKDSVRADLWSRQECSSGMAVRFATNSSQIGVRYNLLWDFSMLHQAPTGTKGTDLYVFEGDSVWRHVNTNRPRVNNPEEKMCQATYVSNLDTTRMTEYMIYLPTYDGVTKLEVAIDSASVITPGDPSIIDSTKKIVAYGTSILQGGCASRPGMASTCILSRDLNCEIANLGFSGEGKMDPELARALATIPDVDVFLIDPVPNCTEMMCDTLTYDFINIIRQARPDVPIVMLEGPIYPYARYDSFFRKYLPAKNAAFRRNYERLKAENPANLYYVDSVNLDGVEDDGTVDGIHLTDLGFKYYADKLRPVLAPLIRP